MSIRDPSWGQDSPRNQIKRAIKRWISNLESGASDPKRVAEQITNICNRIEEYTRVPDMDRWPDLKRDVMLFKALGMALDLTTDMCQANDAGHKLPEGWDRETLDCLHETAHAECIRLADKVIGSSGLLAKYKDPNDEH